MRSLGRGESHGSQVENDLSERGRLRLTLRKDPGFFLLKCLLEFQCSFCILCVLLHFVIITDSVDRLRAVLQALGSSPGMVSMCL